MVKYEVVLTEKIKKKMKKLDKKARETILLFIETNLIECENPRRLGRSLVGNHAGRWRYRVGDYRVVCDIDDSKIIILVIKVGHRSDVYQES